MWKNNQKGENNLFKWNIMQVYKVMKSYRRLSRGLGVSLRVQQGAGPGLGVYLQSKAQGGWVGLRA